MPILTAYDERKKQNPFIKKEEGVLNIKPGIELLSQLATQQVSSPQISFTAECGMESEWDLTGEDTKQWVKETQKTAKKEKP